jgi:ParB/RepB/Spo0J family partition protein
MVAKKKPANAPIIPKRENVIVIDQGKFEIVPLNLIRISKTNRKHFDQLKLTELAASIKDMGVAQPILIRPVTPTADEPEIYEIVAGERRFRASKIAEVTTIPAMIRNLTDLQAAKIQILENLQREDPHELEEALGYQALMLVHGYNADQLAEELKKSRTYIYNRLKLCALAEPLHKDFLDRKFSASTALLIARIPVPDLQLKAAKEITAPQYNGEPMSVRDAQRHLQNRYMLDLTKATFDIKDAKLLATAGNCVKCPKRTGNQPEIFTDMSANICTDPDCFNEKRAALDTRKINDANKKGIPVIDGEAAENYLDEDQDENEVTLNDMGYEFDRVNQSSRFEPVANLIDKSNLPTPVRLLVMPNGKLIELFNKDAIQKLLEQSGKALTEDQATAAEQSKENKPPSDLYLQKLEQDRVIELRVEKENKFRYHLYRIVREKALIQADSPIAMMLTALAKITLRVERSPDAELAEFYDVMPNSDDEGFEYLDKNQDKSLQFILDMLVGNILEANKWSIDDEDNGIEPLLLLAKSVGIDAEQARKDFENPVDATPFKRPLITLKKEPRIATLEEWPFPRPNLETAGAA